MSTRTSIRILLLLLITLSVPLTAVAQGTWADRLKGTAPLVPTPDEQDTGDSATTTVPLGAEYEEAANALKDALELGADHASRTAGKTDGFHGNAGIRIPMPGFLEDAGNMLTGAGLSPQVEALEKSMNRAAEQASAQAGEILSAAIERLSIDDPRTLLISAPDGASRFMRRHQGNQIFEDLRPLVEAALEDTAAGKAFGELNQQIEQRLPALGALDEPDLTDYVTWKTVDGLFVLIGEEEGRIRAQPELRTTEPLRAVFGN